MDIQSTLTTTTTSSSASSAKTTAGHNHYLTPAASPLLNPSSCAPEELAHSSHLDHSPRSRLTQHALFNPTPPHPTYHDAPPHHHSSSSSSSSSDPHCKPHHPLPIKIYPSSYHRSISAPYTSAGVVSLDFPARLDSINEDGAISTLHHLGSPAAMSFIHPLHTPIPYGAAHDSSPS
ncbi:hypothetical protein PCANC_21067 [Puccinia coronata f. sp. avenae]|uniref:Uncharacterized protein n=1 Tax=Puccinia coronata f. sp. avenae TaxID=200324 RepID=A0A2N5U181_9BASI|nr:hypothetical protein PCASD_17600 [Puccinia coronata f. sp. avenae]PLW31497.1 hypothetical protein PCANC_21067 [Puccinia coronata f. sp. avenae]